MKWFYFTWWINKKCKYPQWCKEVHYAFNNSYKILFRWGTSLRSHRSQSIKIIMMYVFDYSTFFAIKWTCKALKERKLLRWNVSLSFYVSLSIMYIFFIFTGFVNGPFYSLYIDFLSPPNPIIVNILFLWQLVYRIKKV